MISEKEKEDLINEYQGLNARMEELSIEDERIRKESMEINERMYVIHDILRKDLKERLEGKEE